MASKLQAKINSEKKNKKKQTDLADLKEIYKMIELTTEIDILKMGQDEYREQQK